MTDPDTRPGCGWGEVGAKHKHTMITFYRHTSLAAAMGVDPATHALHAHEWQRMAAGLDPLPDWADKREARRKVRVHLKLAKRFQRAR